MASFTDVHKRNAGIIVATTRRVLAGRPQPHIDRACVLALATAMVETSPGPRNLASRLRPESLTYPHDDVAEGDATSVGLFQQQDWWGTIGERMNPVTATERFYHGVPSADIPGLLRYNNWTDPTRSFADVIWDVQRCELQFKFRYDAIRPDATVLFRLVQPQEDVLMAVTQEDWDALVAKVDGLVATIGEVDYEGDVRYGVGTAREGHMVARVNGLVAARREDRETLAGIDGKLDALLGLHGPGDPARG